MVLVTSYDLGEALVRSLRALRGFWAGYRRIHERRQLLDRPWEEDLLHFGRDGRLHGHLAPPADGRRHSVTSDGWCVAARRAPGP